jgi:hypothetical protein
MTLPIGRPQGKGRNMFTDTTTIPVIVGATALDLSAAAMEAMPASTLADDISDRLAIADEVEVDDLLKAARLDGRLSADDLDLVEEAAQTRKAEIARALRDHTRRQIKQRRPAATPDIRARIGRWRADIRALLRAGKIPSTAVDYAVELLSFPSIALGGFGMAADKSMAMATRLNVGVNSARHSRRVLEAAGLIEVRREPGKTCLVRPVLRDRSAVFEPPKTINNPRRLTPKTPACHADDLSLTEEKTSSSPPLPPSVPNGSAEEGGAHDLVEAEAAHPQASAPDDVPKKAAAEETVPGCSSRQDLVSVIPEASAKPAAAIRLDDREAFLKVWRATGCVGKEGPAMAAWFGLSAGDKAEALDDVGRPDFRMPDMWCAVWLKGRVWKRSAPAAASASPSCVAIRRGTPQAAVLEKLRGPVRWISDTRTVVLDEPLREALREVAP